LFVQRREYQFSFDLYSSNLCNKNLRNSLSTLVAYFSYYNPGGQSTPEFETLISKANSVQNQEERAQLYSELNEIQAEEVINLIPIVSIPVIYSMDKQVKGFEPNGFGKSVFSNIWIEQ